KIDLNTQEGRRAVFAYALKIDDEVRDRWKDPNIIRQADALLRKAAREMDALYEDLVKAVADVPEQLRNEKMAELLTRLDGPNEYYARFCKEGSITLLDIYRTLRGLSFSVVCKPAELQFFLSIINNYNAIGYRQLDVDVDPFFTPGTRQYEWRSIYNKSVERFAPIIKEMILMAETLPFLVWAAPDNDKQGVFEGAGKFRLRPCHKPK
ncbi:MAG TPA: hypothetical protein VLH77_01200, partial [Gammaproteobacteria bacterium]|nr:hypothetical protein [Gammaproteobacteria bacterium]